MKEQIKPIFIIGAGAVGKALAVFLQAENRKVFLIRGSVDGRQPYQEKIRVMLSETESMQEEITVTTFSQLDTIDGIILVTAKAFGNEELARQLRGKSGVSPIVLLQNGLGVEQPFLLLGFPEIYRCVLFLSSQNDADGVVRYRPVAPSPIGAIAGQAAGIQDIVALTSTPNLPFRTDPQIQITIWEKAIINCAFNSICPLLDTDNGIFSRDENVLQIARRVITECVSVAGEMDIILDNRKIEERLLFISRSSDGQLISTLQDIRGGRQTEIDSLNLAVARMTEAMGKPYLAIETRLLGELVKAKSGF